MHVQSSCFANVFSKTRGSDVIWRSMKVSRGSACSKEEETVARNGFSTFEALIPVWRNHCSQGALSCAIS